MELIERGLNGLGWVKSFFSTRDWSEFGKGYTVLFWVRRLKITLVVLVISIFFTVVLVHFSTFLH